MIYIILSIIICWIIGGQANGKIRDIPCPILLGVGVWLGTGSWIVGILTAGFSQVIRIGYGNYSPEDDDKPSFLAKIFRDRGGWWIRAIWGLIVGVTSGLPYAVYTRHYFFYGAYVLVNIIVNYMVSRLRFNIFVTDFLVSAAFALLIFLPK